MFAPSTIALMACIGIPRLALLPATVRTKQMQLLMQTYKANRAVCLLCSTF